MQEEIKQRLAKTYRMLQQAVPDARIDSFEVVKQVEEYRQYWKPRKINVILLAESHVYTNQDDYNVKCRKSILDRILLLDSSDYPANFVRFIYCLGYGENELLVRKVDRNNQGTPLFWKIFSNCASEEETNVLKMTTWKKTPENLEERLRNKVNALEMMKKKGVWLLDASVVGLTKCGRRMKKEIIRVCWQTHTSKVVKELKPVEVVVIGELVGDVLSPKLRKLETPLRVLGQPRGKSVEYYDVFSKICSRY